MGILRSRVRRFVATAIATVVVAGAASLAGGWIDEQRQRPQQTARDTEQRAFAEFHAYASARSPGDFFPH